MAKTAAESKTKQPESHGNNAAMAPNELEAAREAIRQAGLRATPARIATLLAVRAASAPITHADLADQLAPTGYDKTTAFRNLNDLAQVGLLRRSELGDHVYRFEAIVEHDADGHPHFLCVDCGTVTCLNDVQLTAGSRRSSEEVGDVTEILLRGHCKDCR